MKRPALIIFHFLSVWVFFCAAQNKLSAQTTYRVLFLGNSYTYVNNLPQMVQDVASSAGDNVIFDWYAPGGWNLEDHSLDPNTKAKIMAGNWDYVIIQGQSQEPIMSYNRFINGAYALHLLIRQYNPCAVIMPYMTWGRKNGDAANCPGFPTMCTYQRMDSTLKKRYLYLTDQIKSEVAPVSVVWNHIRKNVAAIDLYQADESHPSLEGTYAAACCFYASLFKKDPTAITFNAGVNAGNAAIIRSAAKKQVFDSLQKWNFKKLPVSNFYYMAGSGNNQLSFGPISQGAEQTYAWDFGDGNTSTNVNPTHTYANNGTYTVTLTTSNCDVQGTHTSVSDTVVQFCAHTPTVYSANNWLCKSDTLWTQPADSYQWLYGNTLLPETNRYLANYMQYGGANVSVISTLNGCAELSHGNTKNVQSSAFYFDALGDPCKGDTVAFAVLHQNGSLPGTQHIYWYVNNWHVPSIDDRDTLYIFTGGKFGVRVVDPASQCPLDTTSYDMTYNCGTVAVTGLREQKQIAAGRVFPNPASEDIRIEFENGLKGEISVYDVTGRLVKELNVSETITINVNDLPKGLYFIHPKGNVQFVLKFIKE